MKSNRPSEIEAGFVRGLHRADREPEHWRARSPKGKAGHLVAYALGLATRGLVLALGAFFALWLLGVELR